MIRIPVMAVLTILALPFRILVTLWAAMIRRKHTVVTWELGGGRKAIEPKAFERMLRTLAQLADDSRVGGLRVELRPLALGLSQVYRLRDAIGRADADARAGACFRPRPTTPPPLGLVSLSVTA